MARPAHRRTVPRGPHQGRGAALRRRRGRKAFGVRDAHRRRPPHRNRQRSLEAVRDHRGIPWPRRPRLPYGNATPVASGAGRPTTPEPSVASPRSGSPVDLDPKVAEPSGQLRISARVWAWPTGTPRWVELQGTVDAVADYWVAVRTDE